MNNPLKSVCNPDKTPLTFGKHKGSTPEEIAEKDFSYIVWMHDNVDKKLCSKQLYNACQDAVEDREDRVFDQNEHW